MTRILPKPNRRRFLQTGGLAAIPAAAAQSGETRKPILITSAGSALAQALAAGLRGRQPLRLTERAAVRTPDPFVECALGADAATNLVVRGVEAIVHVAEPLPADTAEQQVDLLTRCTYNLLLAASQESVARVILLSTLDVMTGYPADLTVTETWRPRPNLQPHVLAKHLGEYTCREFARENKCNVVVLRLGKVVRAADTTGRPDPMWLEERDMIHAVSVALTAKPAPWQVFHIQSDSSGARFAVDRAKAALGYRPQYRW